MLSFLSFPRKVSESGAHQSLAEHPFRTRASQPALEKAAPIDIVRGQRAELL